MTRERIEEFGAAGETPDFALIELLFFAYRDFVADADRLLADDGFGRAHHRVLYFVSRRPGLTVAELLDILKITKQSLNRVLKDLLARGYVASRLGEADRRQRRLHATPKGDALILEVARVQGGRLERALAGASRGGAAGFLAAMVDILPRGTGEDPAQHGGGDRHRRLDAAADRARITAEE